MNKPMPRHYSNHFELRLDKIPARKTDRMSAWIFYIGLILGAALLLLGAYELFDGVTVTRSDFTGNFPATDFQPMINTTFFDIVIMLMGLGIIAALFCNYFQYRRIYFDGKNVEIVTRLLNGKKLRMKEKLAKYDGVRFRIEFAQLGFISRNKYIIELSHKNPEKCVPLYISYRGKNARRLWEYYARTLGLPALVMTADGLVSRKIEHLGKSVKELKKIGELKVDFGISTMPVPKNAAVVWRSDKIVLKIRKTVWDAYNVLAIAVITCAAILIKFIENLAPNLNRGGFMIFYGVMAFFIIMAVIILFRKDKIVIKKYKIVNVHKFFGFSKKHGEMAKSDIEAIDITPNPATGRCFVSIISDKKTIVFGKKLPPEDLRWIKNFLLYELTK